MVLRWVRGSFKMTLRCLMRLEIFYALLRVLDPSVYHHLPSTAKSFTHYSTVSLPQTYQVHSSITSSSAMEKWKLLWEETLNFAVTARRAESLMSLASPQRKYKLEPETSFRHTIFLKKLVNKLLKIKINIFFAITFGKWSIYIYQYSVFCNWAVCFGICFVVVFP